MPLRPSALTIPEVTVCPRPNGLPIATTRSPTLSRSLSPNADGAEAARPGSCSSATSVAGSLPTSCAANSRRSLRVTVTSLGAANDVVVGQDVAARGVDDHARAGADGAPRPRLLGKIEEAPEKGIGEQRIIFRRYLALHGDIDHGRRGPLEQRRERQHAPIGIQLLGVRRAEHDQLGQKTEQGEPPYRAHGIHQTAASTPHTCGAHPHSRRSHRLFGPPGTPSQLSAASWASSRARASEHRD